MKISKIKFCILQIIGRILHCIDRRQIVVLIITDTDLSPIRMRKKYTRVNILRLVYSGVQINLRVNLNCVRMGFIARSFFVGKFIISGLKPVHLSFLYLQNKKRLLQGVHVDFGSRGESCNGQA